MMIENYIDWINSYNIPATQKELLNKLEDFVNLVFKWNKRINITAAKSVKEIVERHILDSLTPILLEIEKEKRVIDLGSGGGFPGIVLAIVLPNIDFILIEKVGKKCAFLNRAKRELFLKNVAVEQALFEEVNFEDKQYSLVTRAVKIDDKLINSMKIKGIKNLYTFHSHQPLKVEKKASYTLPCENKARFIAKRKING